MRSRMAGLYLLIGVSAATAVAGERAATAQAAGPAHETTLEFSVLGMSCETCASSAAEALRAVKGVTEAVVDFGEKRARVRSDGTAGPQQIRDALGTLGFEARFGDETLESDPLPEEVRAGLDVRTISHGEKIRVRDHLAPDKITIFDYYADWCGPCRLLGAKLERLALEYENLAVRRVDLVDYHSAAAAQATREFGLPGLPFTRIFDERGKLLGQVHGNRIEEVEAIVRSRARLRREEAP